MAQALRTIAIIGGGFSAHLMAAACASGLGASARIVLIKPEQRLARDVAYGGATAPTAYEFFRSVGLDEPTLMTRTRSSFSFGTRFENWPSRSSSWVQTCHLPFPVIGGIPFQHYLTAKDEKLEPYLVSAQAALQGKFAHPPNDQNHPLSRAEYGYHFSVVELVNLLAAQAEASAIEVLSSDIQSIRMDGETVASITLDNGQAVEADLYIDASDQPRQLIAKLGAAFQVERSLKITHSEQAGIELDASCRTLTATENGWRASTPLQGWQEILTIEHAGDEPVETPSSLVFEVGKLDRPWVGNCVAVGHAAWGVEPLTAAPMILLQRDIERVLELIPVSADCAMEAREYNRRFEDDIVNVNAFQRALFELDNVPAGAYWQTATRVPAGDRLERKLAQFKSRGLFVRYDLEPFNEEDWAILHNGMGLKPRRYDRQIDGVDWASVDQQLAGLKRAAEQVASKMPPHGLYVRNLKQYLEKQKHA